MQPQVKPVYPSTITSKQIRDVRFLRFLQTVAPAQANKTQQTLAFVSLTSGAGTSAVVNGMGAELIGYTGAPVIVVAAEELKRVAENELGNLMRYYYLTDVRGLIAFNHSGQLKRKKKREPETEEFVSQQLLQAGLKALHRNFNYILLDCPALEVSTDALVFASLVSGVVLVAEAERTTKEHVTWAQNAIEKAGGKVMGAILNKRRYPIPNFVYRWL